MLTPEQFTQSNVRPLYIETKLVYSMVVLQVLSLSCDCQAHLFDNFDPSFFAIFVHDVDQPAYVLDIFSKILSLP